jgi:hypothetical protein
MLRHEPEMCACQAHKAAVRGILNNQSWVKARKYKLNILSWPIHAGQRY